MITALLTSLQNKWCGVKRGAKWIMWSTTAGKAFQHLKQAFTSAPILQHPKPRETVYYRGRCIWYWGGSCIISTLKGEAHTASHGFLFPENSHWQKEIMMWGTDVAVKLALKECRHWLEGAKLTFTVLTDDKNLELLCAAKRLSPRQAWCALFFTRFNFTMAYWPGSKYTKAWHTMPNEPEPIPPQTFWVNAICWEK